MVLTTVWMRVLLQVGISPSVWHGVTTTQCNPLFFTAPQDYLEPSQGVCSKVHSKGVKAACHK